MNFRDGNEAGAGRLAELTNELLQGFSDEEAEHEALIFLPPFLVEC